jgi:HPr kinase/phosphorylase
VSEASGNSKVVTVGELHETLAERLEFETLAGSDGFERAVRTPLIQKPGLILTGMFEFLQSDRIQILGRSELQYLAGLPDAGCSVLERLCTADVPLVVLTRGLDVPACLERSARTAGIPVFRTPKVTGAVIDAITQLLHVRLAPTARVHGVMMDLFGVGVLILGESGVGKSECAAELLSRGHRFIADDAVEVLEIEGELVARSPDLTRHHMEVRGLGIINVREMFGISAVRDTKVIELVIRLVPFGARSRWDRLGSEIGRWEVLSSEVPLVEIPVAAGRNLAVLAEVAVERHLLREAGSDACHDIQAAVARRIARRSPEEGS